MSSWLPFRKKEAATTGKAVVDGQRANGVDPTRPIFAAKVENSALMASPEQKKKKKQQRKAVKNSEKPEKKVDSLVKPPQASVGKPGPTDPRPVEDQLLDIADEECPHVARCIPKGAHPDTSGFPEKSMQHCLYEKPVYDAMVKNSLDVCELLQHKLDDYIDEVRKSPQRELTASETAGSSK